MRHFGLVVMLGLLTLVQRETGRPMTVTIMAALFALAVCASTALMAPRARRFLRLAETTPPSGA